jgi:hypothetical protein
VIVAAVVMRVSLIVAMVVTAVAVLMGMIVIASGMSMAMVVATSFMVMVMVMSVAVPRVGVLVYMLVGVVMTAMVMSATGVCRFRFGGAQLSNEDQPAHRYQSQERDAAKQDGKMELRRQNAVERLASPEEDANDAHESANNQRADLLKAI